MFLKPLVCQLHLWQQPFSNWQVLKSQATIGVRANLKIEYLTVCDQWCSQPRNLGGAKMFERITLFCLEKFLSKHKMTTFSKNLGVHGPFGPPWLHLCVWHLFVVVPTLKRALLLLDLRFEFDLLISSPISRICLQSLSLFHVSLECTMRLVYRDMILFLCMFDTLLDHT